MSDAMLTAQVSELYDRWQTREDELRAWLGGTATGGPNNNGTYALTDANGVSYLVKCPARIVADFQNPTTSSAASASAAAASATAAAAGQAAAVAAQAAAVAAQGVATTRRDEAGNSATLAATSAAQAGAWATQAADAAAAAAGAAAAYLPLTGGVLAGALAVGQSITARHATAIPAGGATGAGLLVSSTANFGVFFGSGAPTLSAAKGSLYLRSDGSGTSGRMYVNTDGGTTWTAVTTAA